MTRPKHHKGSWRAMKEASKTTMHVSKLCKECARDCLHMSIGELQFCWQFKDKHESKDESAEDN